MTVLPDSTARPDPRRADQRAAAQMIDEGGPLAAPNGHRPPRRTSGSARRTARPMSGQGLVYHLADEVAALRHDLLSTSGGRAAKTLVKAEHLRVALIALRAGTILDPHAIAGGASLYLLAGRLTSHLDGRTQDILAGDAVVLSRNLREPLAALEESIILATIAWPGGAGAWDFENTPGHG